MKKLVGKVSLAEVRRAGLVRLAHPPYDVCVALVGGEPCAIEDSCNHAGASLSEGEQSADTVACPMHGYVFSLRSGELVMPRGLCGAQRRYLARIEGDEIVVEDDFALTVLQK